MPISIFISMRMRKLARLLIAVLVGFLVSYFFSYLQWFYVILTILVVMLAMTWSAVYQGLIAFLILSTIAMIFSVSIVPIMTGSFIAIICNLLILPDRVDVVFHSAMVSMLCEYRFYLQAIINLLFDAEKSSSHAEAAMQAKIAVEKKCNTLPHWVLKSRFDWGLQEGYQYFLIKIGQISEQLFALHYFAREKASDFEENQHFNEICYIFNEIRYNLACLTKVLQQ